MADPRDFLLNTDYEMDKIVFVATGELDENNPYIQIKHSLKTFPLIFGVCSPNENFSNSYSLPLNFQSSPFECDLYADTEAVYLDFMPTEETPKIYYRVYAFMPSDVNNSAPATSGYGKNFVLNTDYNYCKLFSAGVVNTLDDPVTIHHGLGYIPQIMLWDIVYEPFSQVPAYIAPLEYNSPTYNILITDQDVTFSAQHHTYYRIYYDEA